MEASRIPEARRSREPARCYASRTAPRRRSRVTRCCSSEREAAAPRRAFAARRCARAPRRSAAPRSPSAKNSTPAGRDRRDHLFLRVRPLRIPASFPRSTGPSGTGPGTARRSRSSAPRAFSRRRRRGGSSSSPAPASRRNPASRRFANPPSPTESPTRTASPWMMISSAILIFFPGRRPSIIFPGRITPSKSKKISIPSKNAPRARHGAPGLCGTRWTPRRWRRRRHFVRTPRRAGPRTRRSSTEWRGPGPTPRTRRSRHSRIWARSAGGSRPSSSRKTSTGSTRGRRESESESGRRRRRPRRGGV